MKIRNEQLGMNHATASNRLVKDLLFDFVQKSGCVCYRCKQPMTREDFSIEHMEPWLHSEDPVKMYFDLNNISYSHKVCNIKAARRVNKRWNNYKEKKTHENEQQRVKWNEIDPEIRKAKRREKYLKYGC